MITENIKNFNDEEIINLINNIVMGEQEADISDLKAILAEASGRKLEKSYINIVAEQIRQKIQPEQPEQKRKTETKPSSKSDVTENTQKFNLDEIYESEPDEEDDEEDEKYPVLSFLAGLYKVFAWILFVGVIVTGGIVSVIFLSGKIFMVCMAMFSAILLSVIFLLMFLGLSENIRLKIDIEKNLRKIISK